MSARVPEPEPGGKLPPCADMRRLRVSHGWSYQDFQDTYGVTNQAVYKKLRKCGLANPRADYSREIPWTIRPEDRFSNVLRMLRIAARERQGILEPLSAEKAREYQLFREKLAYSDAVIGYGPHRDRFGNDGFGFYFTARRPGRDKWLIREPGRSAPPKQRRRVGAG